MSFQTGDIVRVVASSTYYNNAMNNVLFYQVYGSGGNSDRTMNDVLVAIKDLVINVVKTLQSASVLYTLLKGTNITTGSDVSALDLTGIVGNTSLTGDSAAPFIATSVKLNVPSLVTRSGFKRVGGMVEGWMNAQGKVSNTGTLANNVSEALGGIIAYDGTDWFNEGFKDGRAIGDITGYDTLLIPVVVGRNTSTGQYDLTRIGLVENASIQSDITSQVTRKFGRGI